MTFCESKKLNVFDFLPLTFTLDVDSPHYRHDLDHFCNYFLDIDKSLKKSTPFLLKSNRIYMD